MKVIFLDAYNLIHRARFGFVDGPYSIVYNFFRGVRPIIEQFKPDRVYFVLEGNPKHRSDLYQDYKANRRENLSPQQLEDWENFKRQKRIIVDIAKHLPFQIAYHPNYECDDVIAHLVTNTHREDNSVVISNDTDFIQLYNSDAQVVVFSPVKKEYLEPTEYNYVYWKALVGDTADNIKGVPRIGKKTARNILASPETIKNWILNNSDKAEIWERNIELIKFADLNPTLDQLEIIKPDTNLEYVKEKFQEMNFNSITNDAAWLKFSKTFKSLVEGE